MSADFGMFGTRLLRGSITAIPELRGNGHGVQSKPFTTSMVRKAVVQALLLAGVLGAAMSPLAAHHSFAVFDVNKTIDIRGTVKSFNYSNPHIWIDLVVQQPNGQTGIFGIEAGPPSQLRKLGWSSTIIKPGDKLVAVVHPRKDGVPVGSYVTLTFADGTPVGAPKPKPGKKIGEDRKAKVDLATVNPILRSIAPQLKFGTYHQPGGAPEGKDSGPTRDARDFAGRYFPNEATTLAPGDQTKMLPYNDTGARIFLQRATDMLAGKERADPLSLCKPGGAVRAMNQGFPTQIAQSPTLVTIVHMEDHLTRQIRIGGTHRANASSYMGDSIGHWEGNVLVVDTIGFRPGWIDEYGSPSSEKLHLVERFSKLPDGTIAIDATFTDPIYYTAPVHYRRTWRWQPTVSWDEVICEENNRDAPTGK